MAASLSAGEAVREKDWMEVKSGRLTAAALQLVMSGQ